jgi:hypothetical protein
MTDVIERRLGERGAAYLDYTGKILTW